MPACVVTCRSDDDISDHSSAPVASATSSRVTAGWVSGATTVGEMPAARSAACRSTSSRMRAEARSGSLRQFDRRDQQVVQARHTGLDHPGRAQRRPHRPRPQGSGNHDRNARREPNHGANGRAPREQRTEHRRARKHREPRGQCSQQIADAKPGLQAMDQRRGRSSCSSRPPLDAEQHEDHQPDRSAVAHVFGRGLARPRRLARQGGQLGVGHQLRLPAGQRRRQPRFELRRQPRDVAWPLDGNRLEQSRGGQPEAAPQHGPQGAIGTQLLAGSGADGDGRFVEALGPESRALRSWSGRG